MKAINVELDAHAEVYFMEEGEEMDMMINICNDLHEIQERIEEDEFSPSGLGCSTLSVKKQ